MRFQVDVSRSYRNKHGYQVSGYRFNRSFQTETHSAKTFLNTVICEGFPYTVHHAKREPSETGADTRNCSTPKHLENFLSSQILTGDDDSGQANLDDWWCNDPFFSRYGWAFVHSVNSQPHAQKGHPTLIFEQPITDLALWRECLTAFHHAYPQLDPAIKNPVATIYNGVGCKVVHINDLDCVCPFEVFEHCILAPYRASVAMQDAAFSTNNLPLFNASAINLTRANRYVEVAIERLLHDVATAPVGRRHITLRDKSKRIGHLLAAEWHEVRLDSVVDRLIEAAKANGFVQTHGQQHVRRTVESGLSLGRRHPTEIPISLFQ
ncbi:MAG: hypothetical protein ACPG8W_00640 [Candidatus Promineifilaceae bacterium]